MKSILKTLSTSLFLVLMTACGVEGENAVVSSVAAPNLTASALNFTCGNGVVVIEIKNVGNANAGSSFFRVDQSNAGSQAFAVRALKPGESQRIGITVKYKNDALDAKITADSNRTVAESNENDNVLLLVCK